MLVLLVGDACTRSPSGPAFTPAPAPNDVRARVYIFRNDARRSLATVRVTIDGIEVGHFADAEYETLELPAGMHTLRAGMRGFGFVAWGWNEHRFRAGPGETVYLELSVRLTAHPTPASRDLEIAGRPTSSASENVYISQPGAREAMQTLRGTTQVSRKATH